jgi:hypothetical protein
MGIIIVIFAVVVSALLWVSGIDYMKTHHKDYKGEDFLDEEEVD